MAASIICPLNSLKDRHDAIRAPKSLRDAAGLVGGFLRGLASLLRLALPAAQGGLCRVGLVPLAPAQPLPRPGLGGREIAPTLALDKGEQVAALPGLMVEPLAAL